MTPRITCVEARSGHRLRVAFDNGEVRLFDVTPFLDRGVFQELRGEGYFRQVRPVRGGVEWPHDQDLSADTLFRDGKLVTSEEAELRIPEELPFLASISWFDADYRQLEPHDMLSRYEAGWRHLGVLADPSPEESRFIRALIARFGSVLRL